MTDRELGVTGYGGRPQKPRDRRSLFLAEGTVKNHVTNLLTKLEARDHTQAALRARALGLV